MIRAAASLVLLLGLVTPAHAGQDTEIMLALRGMHPRRDLSLTEQIRHILKKDPQAVEKARKAGARPLKTAVAYHRKDVVEILLAHGVDPNDQNGHADAVTEAVRLKQPAILRVLLAGGAKPAPSDLIEATSRGFLDCTKQLVEHGLDPNGQPGARMTPLGLAAESGRLDVARYLLEQGAPVETEAAHRQPLHLATAVGQAEIVKLLLAKGAKPDDAQRNGLRPIQLAVLHGHEDLVRLFAQKGAQKDVFVHAALGEVDKLGADEDLRIARLEHQMLLHVAARFDQLAVVKRLLQARAPIEDPGVFGGTPLIVAATHGREAIVRELLKRGANVKASDRGGATPLHAASAAGGMARGGGPSSKQQPAVAKPYAVIVDVLLRAGSDVHAAQSKSLFVGKRWRPIHLALRAKRKDIVSLLFAAGSKLDYEGADPISIDPAFKSWAVEELMRPR